MRILFLHGHGSNSKASIYTKAKIVAADKGRFLNYSSVGRNKFLRAQQSSKALAKFVKCKIASADRTNDEQPPFERNWHCQCQRSICHFII